ncbi:uncharacterized protein LOC121107880 isoform X1 [Gallus gallus]|uniref:uncharacterized protein LOC121107880 isoform X1 n=1 Tax=Gallus gallus TaxID=9031 RepID=UPI001AE79B06|nr:uncharacterized protein LOC121107880 isoform X1 [Gallus gallus]
MSRRLPMSPVPLWALHKAEIGAKPSRLCSHGGVFLGCLRAPVSITVWVRSLPRGCEEAGLEPDTSFLSFAEIVAIWDAVSDYILEQMKLDKGVLVPGLGLFAAVREQFHSKEVAVSVRRPVFQLGHRGAVAAGPPVAHRHHPRRCQD